MSYLSIGQKIRIWPLRLKMEIYLRLLDFFSIGENQEGIRTVVMGMERTLLSNDALFMEYMAKFFEREDWPVRYLAARNIGRYYERNPKKGLSWLRKFLLDPDERIQQGAVRSLKVLLRHHFESTLPLTKNWLMDKVPEVRLAMIKAMIDYIPHAPDRRVEILLEILTPVMREKHDKVKPYIKRLVGDALGARFPEKTMRWLENMLMDNELVVLLHVARACAGTLAVVFPRRVAEILIRLRYYEEPQLDEAIEETLHELLQQGHDQIVQEFMAYFSAESEEAQA